MPPKNPYQIAENTKVQLDKLATKDTALFKGDKLAGLQKLDMLAKNIAVLQNKLFANGKQRMLIVLQGMDAAGKSSTIREVLRYCNALGVHACSFGKPSEEELKRDYLWRVHAHIPRCGEIMVFDRSHYEDVTTVKVLGLVGTKQLQKRLRHIRHFEQMLIDENTLILKFFLHLSQKEQAKQLIERLSDERKGYKFNPADLEARSQWDAYQQAWSDAIAATTSQDAPWYVIPADRRWYRKLAIAQTVHDALDDLNLGWPEMTNTEQDREKWLATLNQ